MILVRVVDISRDGITHMTITRANNLYMEDVMETTINLKLEKSVKPDVLPRLLDLMKDLKNMIQTKVNFLKIFLARFSEKLSFDKVS